MLCLHNAMYALKVFTTGWLRSSKLLND